MLKKKRDKHNNYNDSILYRDGERERTLHIHLSILGGMGGGSLTGVFFRGGSLTGVFFRGGS